MYVDEAAFRAACPEPFFWFPLEGMSLLGCRAASLPNSRERSTHLHAESSGKEVLQVFHIPYIFFKTINEFILWARNYLGHLKHTIEQNNQDLCPYDACILLEKDVQKFVKVIHTKIKYYAIR